MSFLTLLTRGVLLTALPVLVAAPSSLAEEPAPKFKADLVYVNFPMQITADGAPIFDYDPRTHIDNPFNARIAPRVKCSSSTLLDPIYDVSEYLRKNGVSMPKGSEALYSPRAKLFYINSTAEDVDLAETFVSSPTGDSLFTIDLRAAIKSGRKTETLFELKSVPLPPPGRQMVFTITGKKSMHLLLAQNIGPDAYTVETEILAEVQASGKSLKFVSTWTTHVAESAETTLGKLGDATVTLRMRTRSEHEYFGPGILATKEQKAEAIAEIQKAREHDRSP